MTGARENIGTMSTRRRIATIIAVIGVFVVARTLAQAWPRETPIIYDVGPNIGELDVDILQEGEAVLSARFQRAAESRPRFTHETKLRPGRYQLHITMRDRDDSTFEEVRTLVVPTEGPARLDLAPVSP